MTGQPDEGLEEVPALAEEGTRLVELRAAAELDRIDTWNLPTRRRNAHIPIQTCRRSRLISRQII